MHPRPDRVVVGLRGGDAAAGRALPGVRGRSPRPGPHHAHARPLHARQHGQRPRAVHRRGHRAARDRERPELGRRPRLLAVGVRQARADRRRLLRGSAAVRLAGAAGGRSRHPPVDRSDVRPVEHVPRRPVVDRRVGRDARRGARPSAAVDGGVPDRRRAAAGPQGVRPRVGQGVLDRHGRGVVRPRADAAQRQGATRPVDAPLPRRRREHRHPDGRAQRRPGRSGCRSCCARPVSR